MNTVNDLEQAIHGRLLPESAPAAGSTALGPLATDSRRLEQGEVFWALRGPNYDGADFAAEAFRRGAIGAVVAKSVDVPEGRWVIKVDNTTDALQQWARWKRRHFGGTVIAVTGSVGKTTTRQMIHTVLRSRLAGTASPRNFNNHLGVPLSMSAIEPDHDYAVLELGASSKGEIAALAKLCAPKLGVITQVGDAHLGGFGTRQSIAEAKAELLAALPPEGHAVLGDDPWLRPVVRKCNAQITWVGTCPQCDLTATDVQSKDGQLQFRIALGGYPGVRFSIPVWGRHHLTAALAAVAVGRMMGFDLDEMADLLEDYQPVPMRCEVHRIRGATIINDAYNASPTAMLAALELLRELDAEGRRIVVVGEMGELGNQAMPLHWRLGKQAVTVGRADLLIACGRFARHVAGGARSAGMPTARAIPCETLDDALPQIGQAILPGDVVLVKGSRVMAMERLVAALETYPQRRGA